MKGATKQIIGWIKKESVLVIAIVLAAVSVFMVPPDGQYAGYIDYKTIGLLFCLMSVMAGYQKIGIFQWMGQTLLTKVKMSRSVSAVLVFLCFFTSMFITNDVSLLTFVPFSLIVLEMAEMEELLVPVVVLQTIAANLGSMLLPFGNPQNLYLYTKFNIANGEFVSIMALPFIISVLIITICCIIFVKPEKLELDDEKIKIKPARTIIYLILFVLSIAIVFRTIPYWIGLIIIPVALLFMDRKALKMVDYPLLFTFVFFFIFSGNMARIGAVREFISFLLEKSTLLVSVLSCQIISNVPSAILLSQFTTNYPELLIGVNIGGAGTLVASLASLITFKEFIRHNPDKIWYYIGMFSSFNFGFLILLVSIMIMF